MAVKMYEGNDKTYLDAVAKAKENGLLPREFRPTNRNYRKYQRGLGAAAQMRKR